MTNSPSHVWKAPSRSSSINSLASSYSQVMCFRAKDLHWNYSKTKEKMNKQKRSWIDL